MYWLHRPNPQVPSCIIFLGTLLPCSEPCFLACYYALLGTLLPSMLCSEPCFLLCSARNPASLPDSMLCSTICLELYFLQCSARNPAFLPDSMLCLEPQLFACFYTLLGTPLLCLFLCSAQNPAYSQTDKWFGMRYLLSAIWRL